MTCERSWFSLSISVTSTNKTDRHDITKILLKVALNTINQTKPNHLNKYNPRHNSEIGQSLSSFDKKWWHFNVSGLSSDFVEVHIICGVFVFVCIIVVVVPSIWIFTYQIHKHVITMEHICKLGTSWSYGSWIYNYLSNQCLLPLQMWVRISARCTW